MSFWQTEACGQTVLPDRPVLIGQKLVKKAKIKKNSNATFWALFKQFANTAKYLLKKKCQNILSQKPKIER